MNIELEEDLIVPEWFCWTMNSVFINPEDFL